MCMKPFGKAFWIFTKKHFCYFCMNYICSKCVYPSKTLIPCEYQLKFTVCQETICKEGYEFLTKFSYLKLDKKNPMLFFNTELRRLIVR